MPDTHDFEFCRIDESNYSSLLALMDVVYQRKHELRELSQKFDTDRFGAANIGFLAFPRQEQSSVVRTPAAYYGVFPLRIADGEAVRLAAQSGDTMTHPRYRGHGLFIELANRTYDLAKERGIEFVFGFPNDNSYPGFARKLAWAFPFRMLRFVRYVPTIPVGLAKRQLKISQSSFSKYAIWLMNRLFEWVEPLDRVDSSRERAKLCVLHDRDFWNYKSTNCVAVKKGRARAILKFDGDINIGEIAGDLEHKDITALMRCIDLLAVAIGAVRVRSYFSPDSCMHRALSRFGTCAPSLVYGYRRLQGNCTPEQMELSYVDYDTF